MKIIPKKKLSPKFKNKLKSKIKSNIPKSKYRFSHVKDSHYVIRLKDYINELNNLKRLVYSEKYLLQQHNNLTDLQISPLQKPDSSLQKPDSILQISPLQKHDSSLQISRLQKPDSSLQNEKKEEYIMLNELYKYMIDIDNEVKKNYNMNELNPEVKEYVKQYYIETDEFNSKLNDELKKINPNEDGGIMDVYNKASNIFNQITYLLNTGFKLTKYFINLGSNGIFLWAFIQKLILILAFLIIVIYNPLYFRDIFMWCLSTLFSIVYNSLIIICKYIFPKLWSYIISPILSSLLVALKSFISNLFYESPLIAVGTGTAMIIKLINGFKNIYNYISGQKDGLRKRKSSRRKRKSSRRKRKSSRRKIKSSIRKRKSSIRKRKSSRRKRKSSRRKRKSSRRL